MLLRSGLRRALRSCAEQDHERGGSERVRGGAAAAVHLDAAGVQGRGRGQLLERDRKEVARVCVVLEVCILYTAIRFGIWNECHGIFTCPTTSHLAWTNGQCLKNRGLQGILGLLGGGEALLKNVSICI